MGMWALRIGLCAGALFVFGCMQRSDSSEETYLLSICYQTLAGSPEEIERDITRPVEMIFEGSDDLVSISSVSSLGFSRITLEFSPSVDSDETLDLIASVLSANRSSLPADTPLPVVSYESNVPKSDGCG